MGAQNNESSATSLDAADADGDGRADLLVGAPGERTGGDSAGGAWVMLGSAF
jgi:hypothetical protein